MNKFLNPENHEEILEQLKQCPTLLEVSKLLGETFPSWIEGGYKDFSKDYSRLRKNWHDVCEKLNVKPTLILAVGNYLENDEHSLVRSFAEVFTSSGFCVRRGAEIVGCQKCGLALLSENLHNHLKPDSPEIWLSTCTDC